MEKEISMLLRGRIYRGLLFPLVSRLLRRKSNRGRDQKNIYFKHWAEKNWSCRKYNTHTWQDLVSRNLLLSFFLQVYLCFGLRVTQDELSPPSTRTRTTSSSIHIRVRRTKKCRDVKSFLQKDILSHTLFLNDIFFPKFWSPPLFPLYILPDRLNIREMILLNLTLFFHTIFFPTAVTT